VYREERLHFSIQGSLQHLPGSFTDLSEHAPKSFGTAALAGDRMARGSSSSRGISIAACRARRQVCFRTDGQLAPGTVKTHGGVSFCPRRGAAGELEAPAGYAAFFHALNKHHFRESLEAEHKRRLVFLTNNFAFPPLTIAAL
jgi:hypothetical protein